MDRPLLISDTIDPRGPRHVINLTFLARRIGGAITETPDDPRVEAVDLVQPETAGRAGPAAADRTRAR